MAEEEPQRPAWVWVITIYFVGSTLLALLGFYMILGTNLPIPPASRAIIDSMTTFDWVIVIVTMLCNLAGAAFLFALRRPAPILFSVAFAISLAHTAWQLATGSPQVPSVFGMAIGFGIGLAVIVYAFRLSDRGVLT